MKTFTYFTHTTSFISSKSTTLNKVWAVVVFLFHAIHPKHMEICFVLPLRVFLLIYFLFHQQVLEGSSKENNPTFFILFFVFLYFILFFLFSSLLKGNNKNVENEGKCFLKFFNCYIL